MKNKNDEKINDSLAKGYATGITVLSISAQMVVFPLFGLWVDKRLGTGMLFGALGFFAGLYAAISQLIRLSKPDKPSDDKPDE